LGWDDESEPLETGEVEDAIPEVIWCRFYYYDGFQWQTQWDSGIDEGLPVAVAMHIVVNEPLELTDGELIDPLESWTDASQPSNDEPSALATSRSLPSASAETVTDEFDESNHLCAGGAGSYVGRCRAG
jgi:hypothetical protein